MITSEKAIEKLKDELINRVSHVGLGFRVYKDSAGPGSSRLALKLDNKCPDDETIESHGIRLFIDPFNAAQLKNQELDFIDGPTGGFILKNTKKTM
jgi:Fe-S cluster assembly iron-binding protein IscA